MDGLGNVQQLMLTSESVAHSGERVTLATCGGVSIRADVWGDSVVKQAAQQQSRGGSAGRVECGQTRNTAPRATVVDCHCLIDKEQLLRSTTGRSFNRSPTSVGARQE
eukprot:1346625-Rhodomonas_salina.1